jgi:hypothetical protein
LPIGPRLLLLVTGSVPKFFRDARLRLKVAGQGFRDAHLRMRVQRTRDALLRVKLQFPVADAFVLVKLARARDGRLRYRLAVTRDALLRFNVQPFRDARLRFRLGLVRDAHLRLTPAVSRDARLRFVIASTLFRDARLRFALRLVRDARLRFVVKVARDARLRIRVGARLIRDAHLRGRAARARDAVLRFNVARSYLGLGEPCTMLMFDLAPGDTTVIVEDASLFPVVFPFRIRIDAERMQVVSSGGLDTWTVIRADDGTTAASHTAGAQVCQFALLWIRLTSGLSTWYHTYSGTHLEFSKAIPGGDEHASWHVEYTGTLALPAPNSVVEIGDDRRTVWLGLLEEPRGDFRVDGASLDFVAHGYSTLTTDQRYLIDRVFAGGAGITQIFRQVAYELAPQIRLDDSYIQELGIQLAEDSINYVERSAQDIFNDLASLGDATHQPVTWLVRSRGDNIPILELFAIPAASVSTYSVDLVATAAADLGWRVTDVYNRVSVRYSEGIVTVLDQASIDSLHRIRDHVENLQRVLSSAGEAEAYARTFLNRTKDLTPIASPLTVHYPQRLNGPGGDQLDLWNVLPGRRITVNGIATGQALLPTPPLLIRQMTWRDDARELVLQTEILDSFVRVLGKIADNSNLTQSVPPTAPPDLAAKPVGDAQPEAQYVPPEGGHIVGFPSALPGSLIGPSDSLTEIPDFVPINYQFGSPGVLLDPSTIWPAILVGANCRVLGARIEIVNQDGSSGSITFALARRINNAAAAGTVIDTYTLVNTTTLTLAYAVDDVDPLKVLSWNAFMLPVVSSADNVEMVNVALLAQLMPQAEVVAAIGTGDSDPTAQDPDDPDSEQRGPVITPVSVNAGPTRARVSFTTDVAAICYVEYGRASQTTTYNPGTGTWIIADFDYAHVSSEIERYDDGYGSHSARESDAGTSHVVTLSGLQPNTTYHYRLHAFGKRHAQSISFDLSFTTPDAPSAQPPYPGVQS